jgi:hypothetical protein
MPAVLLGLGLALAPLAVAGAEEPPAGRSQGQAPSDLARDGLEQMMRALSLLVKSIPQYELPEVLDNGDIIIRRKDPAHKPDAEEPEMDETST